MSQQKSRLRRPLCQCSLFSCGLHVSLVLDPVSVAKHLRTHVIYLKGSLITIDDPAAIKILGINLIEIDSSDPDRPTFDEANVYDALQSILNGEQN